MKATAPQLQAITKSNSRMRRNCGVLAREPHNSVAGFLGSSTLTGGRCAYGKSPARLSRFAGAD